jgi:CBS domain-containing protein
MGGHARDLMSGHVSRVEPSESLEDAVARMASGPFGGLPVVSGDTVIGFLSETDLMGALLRRLPPETPISEVMTKPARVVDEFASAEDVMRTMREEGVHHLPVVRGATGKLVGIISPRDVLRYFDERFSGTPAA